MTEADPFPPDCSEKFVHVRRIASGGFGAVFLALHRELRRPAAVKLLLADLLTESEQVDRFNQEARITASLRHPSIIQVIDHGAGFQIPWIAYEFVSGESLRALLDGTRGPPGLDVALDAVIAMAGALEAAHDAGVLHRDIKPDNVLVSEQGQYKITDFGIAKWSREGAVRTRTGIIMGTPTYVSPEQVAGGPATPASDIYALGVTLFELVTGSPPFQDENPMLLLERHLKCPIPRASELKPNLPRVVDPIIEKALAKTPEARYDSARSLASDLLSIKHQLGGPQRMASGNRAARPAGTVPLEPGVILRAPGPTVTPARARAGPGLLVAATLLMILVSRSSLRTPEQRPSRTAPPPRPAASSASGSSMVLDAELGRLQSVVESKPAGATECGDDRPDIDALLAFLSNIERLSEHLPLDAKVIDQVFRIQSAARMRCQLEALPRSASALSGVPIIHGASFSWSDRLDIPRTLVKSLSPEQRLKFDRVIEEERRKMAHWRVLYRALLTVKIDLPAGRGLAHDVARVGVNYAGSTADGDVQLMRWVRAAEDGRPDSWLRRYWRGLFAGARRMEPESAREFGRAFELLLRQPSHGRTGDTLVELASAVDDLIKDFLACCRSRRGPEFQQAARQAQACRQHLAPGAITSDVARQLDKLAAEAPMRSSPRRQVYAPSSSSTPSPSAIRFTKLKYAVTIVTSSIARSVSPAARNSSACAAVTAPGSLVSRRANSTIRRSAPASATRSTSSASPSTMS